MYRPCRWSTLIDIPRNNTRFPFGSLICQNETHYPLSSAYCREHAPRGQRTGHDVLLAWQVNAPHPPYSFAVFWFGIGV